MLGRQNKDLFEEAPVADEAAGLNKVSEQRENKTSNKQNI